MSCARPSSTIRCYPSKSFRHFTTRHNQWVCCSKRYDARNRHDRTEKRNREWDLQLEDLVNAYMTWQAALPTRSTSDDPADAGGSSFTIVVVNFLGTYILLSPSGRALSRYADTGQRTFRRPTPETKTNVAMALEGYIGTSPTSPNIALSFDVLEVYRQFHRVCPRLSIQAHVRALCHLHRVSMASRTRSMY